jgi:segregation and condensation protein B
MENWKKIQAILFFKGEPTNIKRIAEILDITKEEVLLGIEELKKQLQDSGLTLIEQGESVMLGTHKDTSKIIEQLIKEELHRDLGKAGLETLSIVLYLGPITRSEIDYIRGVNSSFILRNLMIRGLVERVERPEDKRAMAYQATFELLGYLGISKISDLPEYEQTRQELLAKEKAREESEAKEE